MKGHTTYRRCALKQKHKKWQFFAMVPISFLRDEHSKGLMDKMIPLESSEDFDTQLSKFIKSEYLWGSDYDYYGYDDRDFEVSYDLWLKDRVNKGIPVHIHDIYPRGEDSPYPIAIYAVGPGT